ncbi:hypothetical protein WR25_15596 isoform D [Diploscapter pachys]|uniref:SSD domain-containing protein n=2 Tax=Diploscapter pachys TaxID=2018661 RepID=A0A2A2M0N1_9BILA|nr:hypothetical protein WR25_15596 isoform D [Diploscapter pachys]
MWDAISSYIAKLLARYPYTSIIGSILICVLMSCGLIHLRLETDIRASFSPEDSMAGYETRVYLEYLNLQQFPLRAFYIFESKNGENILNSKSIEEILSLERIMRSILDNTDSSGIKACHPICSLNRPLFMLFDYLKSPQINESVKNLGFPVSKLDGADTFLGLHLSNVTVDHTNLKSPLYATNALLWYFSRGDTPKRRQQFENATKSYFDLTKEKDVFNTVILRLFDDQIANKEMIRGAVEATTLMTIGFFLLLLFVIFVIVRQTSLKTAPFMIAATLITPFVATISSFGLLCWTGFPVYSIQCVVPFLVLGIGVDDAFILIHRWRYRSIISDKAVRLQQVIVDVGPSITITSLTNIIAFGVGFFTPTPQMSLFCLATSVSLLLDYILTYTALSPLLYILNDAKIYSQLPHKEKSKYYQILEKYSKIISSLNGRLFCGLFLLVLYGFSTYGLWNMKQSFDPTKAFPSDSKLVTAIDALRPIFDQFYPLNIYVNKPPEISDKAQYSMFNKMIADLKHVHGVNNDDKRVMLFLKQYELFDRKVDSMYDILGLNENGYQPSLKNMGFFLKQLGSDSEFIAKYHRDNQSDPGHLKAFRFTLLGEGMSEWAERALMVEETRAILDKYPQFNATLFDADSAVLTLIRKVGIDLVGSIAVTVGCLAVVCIVFIYNCVGVIIMTYVIISICYCLVGCLAWWGADLDPVTQVDVLLATGFSVDYTAHVAYQYFRASGSPQEKVLSSLHEMAAPMIEAGLSTFLCMLPLILVPTYAIVAFAKTIFLTVGIGKLEFQK